MASLASLRPQLPILWLRRHRRRLERGYGLRDGLSLTSAGGGVRLFFDGDLRADVGVGVPLSYRSPNNENRSPVLLFSLSNAFRLCPERAQFGCNLIGNRYSYGYDELSHNSTRKRAQMRTSCPCRLRYPLLAPAHMRAKL